MVREDKLREQNKTIKQLRGQVRQLRKALKEAESELFLIRELWQEDVLDMARQLRREKIETKRNLCLCPQCGNDTLTTSIIGVWKLERCSSCDHFERTKQDEDA